MSHQRMEVDEDSEGESEMSSISTYVSDFDHTVRIPGGVGNIWEGTPGSLTGMTVEFQNLATEEWTLSCRIGRYYPLDERIRRFREGDTHTPTMPEHGMYRYKIIIPEDTEIVRSEAYSTCRSIRKVNLPSAKVVGEAAFLDCEAITEAKFGINLEKLEDFAFKDCIHLKLITIPLKNNLFEGNYVFSGCENLADVDLVESDVLDETVDALHFEQWRDDLDEIIFSINEVLPNASFGFGHEKTQVIEDWIETVLERIHYYKTEHRRILNEIAPTLQLVLPSDIVMNNVLQFLELPAHKFHGED